MKNLLIASTALVAMTGVAAADVAISGDGRMGIRYDSANANELSFTSRIRIAFAATGETDSGLSFGGGVRADNAVGGAAGTAGSVFISGEFGKLSMGDVDGAAKASVGHVAGVGLTGVGDFNESTYVANAGNTDPSALYEYSTGNVGLKVSASNPSDGNVEYALGVTYAAGGYSVALGYEDDGATTHVIGGASATFGGISAKVIYGKASGGLDQYSLSGTYTSGAISASAFYSSDLADQDAAGIGASYDLGGGASLVGGVARKQGTGTIADFGVSMSF